jgi:hypothetical protein
MPCIIQKRRERTKWDQLPLSMFGNSAKRGSQSLDTPTSSFGRQRSAPAFRPTPRPVRPSARPSSATHSGLKFDTPISFSCHTLAPPPPPSSPSGGDPRTTVGARARARKLAHRGLRLMGSRRPPRPSSWSCQRLGRARHTTPGRGRQRRRPRQARCLFLPSPCRCDAWSPAPPGWWYARQHGHALPPPRIAFLYITYLAHFISNSILFKPCLKQFVNLVATP